MSPSVFDGDAAVYAAMNPRPLWAEFDAAQPENAQPHEVAVRFAAAVRAGDDDTRTALILRAIELDAAQPFGPRLMDEIRAISRPLDEVA
jgi:hypothetical protein